jgi:uncharacterized Fe-S center protein
MKSPVYFIDLRATYRKNFTDKLALLLDRSGLRDTVAPRDLVAVKIHFGETGNTAFIRPVLVRKIVEEIKSVNALPFLTDANTLYLGTRSDAVHHLSTAVRNGFAYSVVEAPVIIADGLRGKSEVCVRIDQKQFQDVYIAHDVVAADAILSLAHFKGHELSGFGGTIKNLGMGCASRKGKLAQHSSVSPKVKKKKCIGCGECTTRCVQDAISLIKEKAVIDPEKCIGCGECIIICPNKAVEIQWNQTVPDFLECMVEYTMGVLKGKEGKTLYLNFLTDISPACDCLPLNDAPIVRDIGVVASKDPVAIDQASVDLVNQESALPGSCLKENTGPGADKFRGVYPEIDWTHQLEYAEKIGLGSRAYELIRID